MATTRATEHALARRDAILQAVSFAASGFLRASDWQDSTQRLLGQLGVATEVHRIYVFQNDRGPDGELLASQRFEWAAPGVPPQIDNPDLQNVPFEAAGFARWAEAMARGDVIVGNVRELPAGERELLAPQGIEALLVVPIYVGDEWWGFMGFDDCEGEREWSAGEQEALRAAAGAMGAAIQRQRTEEALRQSELQLRHAQKMEAIGQLAGGVAHDFNNLLTVIQGNASFLLDGLEASDPRRAEVMEIREATARASALTHQLLAFSRRQVLNPHVVEVNAIVEGLLPMLRRLIGEDVQIVTALSPGASSVLADQRQLEQVLVNLAVNARDAMPQGGTLTLLTARQYLEPTPLRTHASQRAGDYVLLAVSDTGTGMDRETQARAFEPFFTTKEPGRGTGLGLSTVYGIVKQSGGWIWCYSEPGQGTTFKIYLPPADRPAEAPAPAAEPAVSVPPASGTVLLVEDDDAVRRLARRVLSGAGYDVLGANGGREALDLLQRHPGPIALVVADLVMPEMNGRELVTRMRAVRPELRVLFVSGYTDDDIVRRGLTTPGSRFLEKPFSPTALIEAVRQAAED